MTEEHSESEGKQPHNFDKNPGRSISGHTVVSYKDLFRVGLSEDGLTVNPRLPKSTGIPSRRREMPPAREHYSGSDLPEDHFVQLTDEEAQAKKIEHWKSINNLPEDDLRKILYYRRFPDERSWMGLSPELRDQLHGGLRYYGGTDVSRISELPHVDPHHTLIDVPEGRKIGFIIGYHHIEKPWSNLFMEMMRQQVQFKQGSIEFILIKNDNIPTGDPSPESDREIRKAVEERDITDVIDVHEQTSTLNHYMDYDDARTFADTFRKGSKKNPAGGEYTLDPFVPLWAIEQYYGGHVYPQLQHAVNEQIKKAKILIESTGKR